MAAGLFSFGTAIIACIGNRLRLRVTSRLGVLQGGFAEAHKEGVGNFPPEALHTVALDHLFLEKNRPARIGGKDARGGQHDIPSPVFELHTAA